MSGRRRTVEGVVVSDKMQKTVVVAVATRRPHPLYKKVLRRTRRYKAHDEESLCQMGDRVVIEESRHLAREVRWRVVQILSPGKMPQVEPEASGRDRLGDGEESDQG